MKKRLMVILALLMLTGCQEKACNPNHEICIDEEKNDYVLEENPTVVMSFENQSQQDAFIALWDETYPLLQGVLQGVVYEDDTYQSYVEQPSDLVLLDSYQATLTKSEWQNYDEHLKEKILPHLCENMLVDIDEFFFLPLTADGSSLIVNTTRLSEMGIALEDTNEDGLIDAIDSFEKWQDYGLSLDLFMEDWSFSYAFMMLDVELFKDINLELNPFTKEGMLQYLTDVKALSKVINISELTSESFFENKDQNVALMHRWMYYQSEDENVMRISKLPTINHRQPQNLIYAKGYVLNKASTAKNTAHKVMELLYTQKGLQTMIDTSDSIVVYPSAKSFITLEELEAQNKSDEEITLVEPYHLNYKNTFDKMMAESYQYGVLEDAQAVETDLTVRYFDCLDDIMLQEVCEELWLDMITPEQAQEILIERYDAWSASYKEGADEVSS